MAKDPMDRQIGIGPFVEKIKEEIVEYQKKHENDPAAFRIRELEIGAEIGVTYTAEGRLKLWVFEAGDKQDFAHKHTLALRLDFVGPNDGGTKGGSGGGPPDDGDVAPDNPETAPSGGKEQSDEEKTRAEIVRPDSPFMEEPEKQRAKEKEEGSPEPA